MSSNYGEEGPDNSDRAEWAGNAISGFCDETGLDEEIERRESVSDLICNLGHYCDRHKIDFLAVLAGAISVWDAEKREEKDGKVGGLIAERKFSISLTK